MVEVQTPEPDCWLNPRSRSPTLKDRRARAVHDDRDLGGCLGVSSRWAASWFRGARCTPRSARIRQHHLGRQRLHLVLPPRCPNGYGNHSSDPNLWWDGPYDLIARRPIRAGEELTNEYATSTAVDGFTMTCECRTSVCRGLVCGDDWMRSDLQARYDGHCVPLLLAGSRSVGRGPHDDRHPVSRLGTLEGGEGACSRRRNSPG